MVFKEKIFWFVFLSAWSLAKEMYGGNLKEECVNEYYVNNSGQPHSLN